MVKDFLRVQFKLDFFSGLMIGMLTSIILAHIKIFNLVVVFALKVAFSSDLWYMRVLAFIAIFAIMYFIYRAAKKADAELAALKKRNAERETAIRQKELKHYAKKSGLDKS